MSDPILEALARIEAKQDDMLANQARMDEELPRIVARVMQDVRPG